MSGGAALLVSRARVGARGRARGRARANAGVSVHVSIHTSNSACARNCLRHQPINLKQFALAASQLVGADD